MNYLRGYIHGVKYEYKMQGFPKISTGLLFAGAGVYILGKTENNSSYLKDSLAKMSTFLVNFLNEGRQKIPIIPKQEIVKPTFVFDLDKFLIYRRFPFFNFGAIKKRAYTGTFLFHMAHVYDLILVTKMSPYEGRGIIEQIDPYGCIGYRLFVKNKEDFRMENLNRDPKTTIFLETGKSEMPVEFSRNTLKINKWKGEEDDKLLELLDFCVSLPLFNVDDFRNTLCSYQGRDFFRSFDTIQRRIFKEKNIFTFNINKSYETRMKRVKEERHGIYEQAKIELDQHLAREKLLERGESITNRIYNLVISNIF